MKDYIINNPQLQSVRSRISGFIVWAMCWLMWCYLLLPVITLGGWLLGEKKLVKEMRWFGGYKSLLQLMEIYIVTLLVIALLWLIWVIYHAVRPQAFAKGAFKQISDAELCQFYQVNSTALQTCRQANLMTVYFDEAGNIVQLAPEIKTKQ